jgi:hypothetical protein
MKLVLIVIVDVTGGKMKRALLVIGALSLLLCKAAFGQDSLFAPAVNLYIDYGMADVIAADLDNDGYNDLAVADNDSYNIGIYENDGFGNFSHVATYGVGANPGWIVAKDLNADGKLDIAISNDFTHDVTVFWGNGDCTFQNAFSLYTDGRNGEVIAVDINNDSYLNLMVSVFSQNHIAYFINNGNGTFQNVQYIPTSGSPFAIYSNNFDSDSDEDIAFTALSNLCVMLNDGAGNFSSVGTIPMCSGTYSNTGGDVDNDGDVDIVSVNSGCNQIQIFLNNGSGVFSPGSIYATSIGPLDAELADLNNDGNLDIVTANKRQTFNTGNCSVFLGMGNGAFTLENNYATGQWPGAVYIADLNGDQNLDFAVANFGAGTVSIFYNNNCFVTRFYLQTPPNNQVSTESRLIWSRSASSCSLSQVFYNIYFDDNAIFSSADSFCGLTDTIFALPDSLPHSNRYYWKVFAYDTLSPKRSCQETFSFYLDGYPTSPSIFGPTNGAHIDTATSLNWLTATDPDSFDVITYSVQIDEESLFGSPEVYDTVTAGPILDNALSIEIKQLAGYQNLLPNHLYYWRVRADDHYGLSSACQRVCIISFIYRKIIHLSRSPCNPPWQESEGLIITYISNGTARQIMIRCRPSTFIFNTVAIRFLAGLHLFCLADRIHL